MARTFSPGPNVVALPQAAACFPAFLAILVGARAVGDVASVDRHAVLILGFRDRPGRLLRRRATTTAMILSEMALLAVMFVPAIEAAAVGAALATKSVAVGVLVAVVAVAPVTLCALPAARTLPALTRAHVHQRTARLSGLDTSRSIRAEILAAWPTRHGHATRLVTRLQALTTANDPPLWATARTTELAEVYNRWGLQPISHGSVVVNTPARGPVGTHDHES